MKKIFFIPFILGILIGFYGCNVSNNGNISTYPAAPAVIEIDVKDGGTIMGTPWGYFAAPSLTHPLDVNPFDRYYCLFVKEFTIDFDNQPSPDFYTATNIVREDIEKYSFEQKPSIELEDYTLPLHYLTGAASEFYNGKFFISAISKDKSPQFRLVYNSNELEDNNVKNLYLLAKQSATISSSDSINALGVFDLSYFVNYSQGRDTTISIGGYSNDYKYVRINLKFIHHFIDGEPKFENAPNQFIILMRK